MSEGQKVIKYIAIAFAIFLTVNIIGGIITAFACIAGVTGIVSISNNTENMVDFSESYTQVEQIQIECKLSNLSIEQGDEFKVEATTIEDKFECENKDGILKIREKEFRFFRNNVSDSNITVYIPENEKLTNVKIETGAGKVTIEKLSTDKLKLDLGAGSVKISDINVEKEAKINGGVGKVKIENSILNNLELDCGVGEFEMTAKLIGNTDIDCGVGRLEVNLIGNEDDYKISAKKGLGSFTIKSKEIQNDTTYGNGENYIKIEAGVGSTAVKYK